MSKFTYININVREGLGQSLYKFLEAKGVSHCHHLQLLLGFVHCQHLVLFIPPSDRFRDWVSERTSTSSSNCCYSALSEITRTPSLQVFLPNAFFRSTCPLINSLARSGLEHFGGLAQLPQACYARHSDFGFQIVRRGALRAKTWELLTRLERSRV